MSQATAEPRDVVLPPAELLRQTEGSHLPLRFVAAVAPLLEVRFHAFDGLAMAFYVPPVPVAAGPGAQPGNGEAAPAMAAPRLMLYRPYFGRDDGLVPLADMPPDMTEYWSHALLLAYLHLEVLGAGPPRAEEVPAAESAYAAIIATRAAALHPGLDAEQAEGIYLTAVASFGSHLLSLANEVERLVRRRPDRDLCAAIHEERLHFRTWRRAFELELYVGIQAEGGRSGGAKPMRPIEREDKMAFVEHVFDGVWTGDPVRDFGPRYCRSTSP